MRDTATDTSPDIAERQRTFFREAPPWRKLEMMGELNRSVKLLAMSGIRHRFPDGSEAELERELARLMLGRDLADRLFERETRGG